MGALFVLVLLGLFFLCMAVQWKGLALAIIVAIIAVALTDGALLRLVDFGFCPHCNRRVWMARSKRQWDDWLLGVYHLTCPSCSTALGGWSCG